QGPAAAVEAASGRASFPRRSLLDERSQALEGIVPLLRDSVQVSARLLEAPRLELPDALASATFAAHETRSGERMKVLRDGLARDGSARAQTHDGEWSFPAEAGDEPQSRLLPERPEDRRGADQPDARGATLPRHCARWSPSCRPTPGRS